MRFFRESCRFLCIPLAVLMMLMSAPWSTVRAALVTTDEVIGTTATDTASADREKIVHFLQQESVRKQLTAMGVQPAQVEARLAALSPNELAQIAGRIDQMPAGQGTIGIIIGAALIIFLVLLITDLVGVTDVFPFVKKHR
jgi:hypothetical protein